MRALVQDDEGLGLRITPLIDIVFLLLIFFLVATTFYEEEKDITIRLAQAGEGADRERSPRMLVVNVRKTGVLVVGERLKTFEQLEADLQAARKTHPDMVVVVRADRHTYHKHFVRVLDLCEKVGVGGVAVAIFQSGE